MNRALYAAATGMAAQQQTLDVVADNLANADVIGFKRATATFAAIGADLGTAGTGVRRSFEQGKLERSGGPFDVAIDGAGFFVVERDGVRGYTRAGSFARAADGTLQNAEGWRLSGVRVPSDAAQIDVAPDGAVEVELVGGARRPAGRIRLAGFLAPERLRPIGSALFAATHESGAPATLTSGGTRGPKIAFGMLEHANVSIVEAMMSILAAQRAYEANAKGVQAADEMQRIANAMQSIANDLQGRPPTYADESTHVPGEHRESAWTTENGLGCNPNATRIAGGVLEWLTRDYESAVSRTDAMSGPHSYHGPKGPTDSGDSTVFPTLETRKTLRRH